MKILVLNAGSSSLKCSLFVFSSFPKHLLYPTWQAHIQWKNNSRKASLTIESKSSPKFTKNLILGSDHLEKMLKHLMVELVEGKGAVISSLKEIDVVGHRIVHGGKYYYKSVLINKSVKKNIKSLRDLAPLHNQADLESIDVMEKLLKGKPQVAVFDTAFHQTLPNFAAVFPIPYKRFEEGIKRYGFHGMSFQYCSKRAAEILKSDINSIKMVICHLGSGASLCAIDQGKSIDTTMGFTPLDGLMMDTRSGGIDPGILLYLMKNGKRSLEALSKELYQESGLLGISGISSDMRDIMKKAEKGNKRAKLALDVYCHRLCTLIGSMIASLKGMDVLIFTAGIGENSPHLRKIVCDTFSFLGVKLDINKNQSAAEDSLLSPPDSKIKVLMIHTQESFEIARECYKCIT